MKKGYEKFNARNGVKIEVIRTGAVVTALVEMPDMVKIIRDGCFRTDVPLRAFGEASCGIGDDFDLDIGLKLATAAALRSLSAQIRRDALGVVKHRNDMKDQRLRQAIRRQERIVKRSMERSKEIGTQIDELRQQAVQMAEEEDLIPFDSGC